LLIDRGPLNVRLTSLVTKKLSIPLSSSAQYILCEFSRKPRGLNELSRFKATEFRQILVYTGQIIFKNYLSDDCYKHFMLLNIAMTILLINDMGIYIDYAQELLEYFVQNFELIYYVKHLVSNMSMLLFT